MFLISALLHGYRQDAAAATQMEFQRFSWDSSERFLEIIINIFENKTLSAKLVPKQSMIECIK